MVRTPTREGFGDVAGFINAWSYWCAAWPGNAGIVVSWVFYVQALFGWDPNDRVQSVIIALVGLWVPTSQAAARNRLFPEIFERENRAGVPAFGIVSSTVLASIAVVLALSGSGGVAAFSQIVLFSGVTVGVPYFFSVMVQLYYLYTEGRRVNPRTA